MWCAVLPDVELRDVVIGMGACTDSKVNRLRFKDQDFAAIADFELVQKCCLCCESKKDIKVRVGNIFSADLFYLARSRKCLM